MGELAPAKRDEFGLGHVHAITSSPYFRLGTPMTCAWLTAGNRVQAFFDLARRNVFAAANDHVLDSADDARGEPLFSLCASVGSLRSHRASKI